MDLWGGRGEDRQALARETSLKSLTVRRSRGSYFIYLIGLLIFGSGLGEVLWSASFPQGSGRSLILPFIETGVREGSLGGGEDLIVIQIERLLTEELKREGYTNFVGESVLSGGRMTRERLMEVATAVAREKEVDVLFFGTYEFLGSGQVKVEVYLMRDRGAVLEEMRTVLLLVSEMEEDFIDILRGRKRSRKFKASAESKAIDRWVQRFLRVGGGVHWGEGWVLCGGVGAVVASGNGNGNDFSTLAVLMGVSREAYLGGLQYKILNSLVSGYGVRGYYYRAWGGETSGLRLGLSGELSLYFGIAGLEMDFFYQWVLTGSRADAFENEFKLYWGTFVRIPLSVFRKGGRK